MSTSTTSIPDPSTRYRRTGQRGLNAEMLSWMFMRGSGALLVILVFGHLFVNLWLGDGVKGIDFAFVGGKWSSPFWQVWDLLMLWLGLIHGGNGVRTIINDYTRRGSARFWLTMILYIATAVIIILGTLVIFTFDPCMVDASGALLEGSPAFCG